MRSRKPTSAKRVLAGTATMLAAATAIPLSAAPAHAVTRSCTVPSVGGCGTGSISPNSAGTIWLAAFKASAGGGSVTCRLYTAGGIEKGSVNDDRTDGNWREVAVRGLSGSHFAAGVGSSGADGFCRIRNS